jgi:maleate isomerase
VTAVTGLRIERDADIARLREDQVLELAREAARDGGDAVFLSCTNLPTLRPIDRLESELRRPLVMSTAATVWQALRMIGALPGRTG